MLYEIQERNNHGSGKERNKINIEQNNEPRSSVSTA